MVSLISGLVGGLVATIIMTVFMMTLGGDSPPPTALFWSKYVGNGDPGEYMMQGMVLHMLYGIIAGGVFTIGVGIFGLSVARLGSGLLWGLAYGVLLFIGAAVFWMNIVLDLDAEMKIVGMFLFFHLVYGVVLGAWTGLNILA
ncbi:hypothetical protein [Halorussus sp. AFM4]|uniref:hypothetical protein n=1 Tax=Halorussus sp. AFM4 TaxID=3421651 RepID=UPI003EBB9BBC